MFEVIIAGVLQGVLEWLPVSSQGIVSVFLQNAGYSFKESVDIALFLHAGTLLATVSFFWKELKKLAVPKTSNDAGLLRFVLLTTIFSLIIAGPLYLIIGFVSENFAGKTNLLIGSLLIITGLVQLFRKGLGNRQVKGVRNSDALVNGLAQGLAVLPGISRSGITTLALLVMGFNIHSALKLSFLASIPSVFIAQLVSGVRNGFFFQSSYLLAGLVSFIVGRFTIKYLLKLAERINFSLFCISFGLLTIIF